MSTLPGRGAEPDSPRGSALIGKSVMVKGQVFSREDLTVDGELEGTIELQEHRLTVGPNGKVQASIKAREIVILGTVHGNIEASERIDIRKDAKLVGDLKTVRIMIEDGAYFKGSIDIQKPEVSRPAVAARPQPPAAAAAASAPHQPPLVASPNPADAKR
jgi:cytoskeletal protein CcmA (bactofilin family)